MVDERMHERQSEAPASAGDSSFVDRTNRELRAIAARLRTPVTLDIHFLAYLRQVARFGYFTLGPITIDVRLIEDIVERTSRPGDPLSMSDDNARFSHLLMQEVRRS